MVLPLIAGGISLLGGILGKKRDEKLAQGMRTTLGNTNFSGPAGMSAWAGENGTGFDVGGFGPALWSSLALGGSASETARTMAGGVPVNVLNAADALSGQNLDLAPFLQGQFGGASLAGKSLADIFGGGFNPDNIAATQLAKMRAAARPGEEQATRSFMQNLYSSGRGAVTGAVGNEGSVGGGRLAAAFGEGLGRADLERQVMAQEQGIQSAVASENLLRSAFSRFMDTSQFAAENNTAAFNRTRGVLTDNFDRSIQMAGLPAQLAAAFQGLAGGAIGNANSILDTGMNQAGMALNTGQAAGNLRIGSGSNVAAFMNERSTTPGLDSMASLFAGLSQPGDADGVRSFFGNILSGRRSSGATPGILDSSGSPIPGTYAMVK